MAEAIPRPAQEAPKPTGGSAETGNGASRSEGVRARLTSRINSMLGRGEQTDTLKAFKTLSEAEGRKDRGNRSSEKWRNVTERSRFKRKLTPDAQAWYGQHKDEINAKYKKDTKGTTLSRRDQFRGMGDAIYGHMDSAGASSRALRETIDRTHGSKAYKDAVQTRLADEMGQKGSTLTARETRRYRREVLTDMVGDKRAEFNPGVQQERAAKAEEQQKSAQAEQRRAREAQDDADRDVTSQEGFKGTLKSVLKDMSAESDGKPVDLADAKRRAIEKHREVAKEQRAADVKAVTDSGEYHDVLADMMMTSDDSTDHAKLQTEAMDKAIKAKHDREKPADGTGTTPDAGTPRTGTPAERLPVDYDATSEAEDILTTAGVPRESMSDFLKGDLGQPFLDAIAENPASAKDVMAMIPLAQDVKNKYFPDDAVVEKLVAQGVDVQQMIFDMASDKYFNDLKGAGKEVTAEQKSKIMAIIRALITGVAIVAGTVAKETVVTAAERAGSAAA